MSSPTPMSVAVNIGMISTSPPIEIATTVRSAKRPARPSSTRRCHAPQLASLTPAAGSSPPFWSFGVRLSSVIVVSSRGRGRRSGIARLPGPADGLPEVDSHHDRADEVHRPAEKAQPQERLEPRRDVEEDRVGELAGVVEGAPLQALHQAG